MRTLTKPSSFFGHVFTAVALCAGLCLTLSGCGMGAIAPATQDAPGSGNSLGLGGKAMGGEIPIVGGAVTLYETQPNGAAQTAGYYAGTPVIMDTTTTGAGGYFKFTHGATCSDPDEVYITISGGNSGGSQSNPSTLLLSALGPCSAIPTTAIVVNEVTTAAAAYALAGFTSISNSCTTGSYTASPCVAITSSSNNYAATAGAAGTMNHPVGLQHAFLNVANIVNTGGVALTVLPSSVTTGNTGSAPLTPYVTLNTVANVLQICTNSTGATPELSFTTGPTPDPTTAATLTSSTLLSATDTISGSLSLQYAGGSTMTVGPYSGATQATVASDIQTAFGAGNVAASWSAGVLTITGTAGTGNTLVLENADTQNANASQLLDIPVTAGAYTSTACGNALQYALPINDTTTPTTTLQAALNIARNPWMSGNAATFIANITGTGTPPFVPYIKGGTIHDLSAAIIFPASTYGLKYPYPATLDANDNYYVANGTTTSNTAYQAMNILGLTSNGALYVTHPFCSTSSYSTHTGYDQTNCAEPYSSIRGLAADANGYVWLVNTGVGSGSTTAATNATWAATQPNLLQFNPSTNAIVGSSTSTQNSGIFAPGAVGSIAIDQANNIWIGVLSTAQTYNVYEYPYAASTGCTAGTSLCVNNAYSTTTAPYTGMGHGAHPGYAEGIAIDAFQNIWSGTYETSSANYSYVIANQYAPSTTYTTNPTFTATPAYVACTACTTSAALTGNSVLGEAFDSNGIAYATTSVTTPGLNPVTPHYSANSGIYTGYAVISSLSAGTEVVGSSTTSSTVNAAANLLRYPAADGLGVIWVPDGSNGLVRISGSSYLSYQPCIPTVSGNTATCSVTFGGPRNIVVDSTGSIWLDDAAAAASNLLYQYLGAAAPAYPLLQAGHPGLMP